MSNVNTVVISSEEYFYLKKCEILVKNAFENCSVMQYSNFEPDAYFFIENKLAEKLFPEETKTAIKKSLEAVGNDSKKEGEK